MGSLEAERTTTGWAGREVAGILSSPTYALRKTSQYDEVLVPSSRGGILGLGGVEHERLKIAKAWEHHVTVISSSDKKKVEALEHLGADLVISDSEGMQKAADSLDYLIETVPVFHPLERCLSLLKLSGKFILAVVINSPMVMLERKSITGSFIGSMKETDEMLQFCKEKVSTSMIEVVKMDYVNTAMERLKKRDVPNRVSQEGKVVSIGRNMKEKIKGYFSSLLLYFDKSRTHEFGQEASNTKPITRQDENKGWFKVCLMLFLVFTTVPRGVRSEDIGNPLIPGSTAMDSLLASKNLRGLKLSEERQMVGMAMNGNFNYHDFPHWNSPPNNPASNQANPYQRPCNPSDYCRQGKKGKKN